MENTREFNVTNVKNLTDQPLYYGAYLNMARHNILLLLKHLQERFQEIDCIKISMKDDEIKDKNFLLTVFDINIEGIPDERRLGILNYILKRNLLPVLKYFKTKSDSRKEPDITELFKELHNFLKSIFDEINELRNDYTHFLTIDRTTGEKLEKRKHTNSFLKDNLTKLFNASFSFAADRHFQTLETSDFEHLKDYKLFKDNSDEYTDKGFYFIVCLFLETAHAVKFLKKFRGFKNETIKPFLATLKAFTYYALRTPSVKLVNEDKKQTLLTQMLTELNKCPKELFNRLTEEDKKQFELSHKSEEAQKNIFSNSINIDELNDWEIENALKEFRTLKRHNDRFPYFALQYLDETDAFDSIRFQISLGKIFIKEYNKTITGEKQKRRISKEIKAFGKLSDFELTEDSVSDQLKKKYNDENIYFEQYAPHYNIQNNKIGIYLFPENEGQKNIIGDKPTAFISLHELPKLITSVILQQKQAEKLIKEFIEESNTKMLDYYFLKSIRNQLEFNPEELTRRRIDETKQLRGKALKEEKIKQNSYIEYLDRRKEKLNALLAVHNLQANQLPSQVSDYLLKINEAEQKIIIHFTIKQMRDDAKQLLKKIKKETSKPKEEQNIKLGELATYLARDIIDMVIDKNVKQKITSPYYNILQNKLAYFSTSKEEITELCKELELFDKSKGHVFLTENLINRSSGIIDFYIKYLKEKQGIREGFKVIKKGWFDNLQHTYKENGKYKTDYVLNNKDIKIPYTLSKLNIKVSEPRNFETWLKAKRNMPVNLPVNLLDKPVNGFLKSKTREKGKTGFSQLLGNYLNEDIQPFYLYKREYDKAIEKGKETVFESDIFDTAVMTAKQIKKVSKKADKNEKVIRFHQTKDRVMNLMCKELLKESKTFESEELISLKDIYPGSETSTLDKQARFSKTFKPCRRCKTYTIIANDDYKPKDQLGYSWTIKDFGIFSRFINDRRLPGLLEYFDEKENVPYELLQHEIKEYKMYQDKIFEEISKIEETIIEKDLPGLKRIHLENSDYNQLQFKIYLKWLMEKTIYFDGSYIREIRNSFSHNQFTGADITGLTITETQIKEFREKQHEKGYKSEQYKSLSMQIYENYKQKTEQLINEINKI